MSEAEVQSHFENLKRGLNYFGEGPRKSNTDRSVRLSRGQTMHFGASNGFPVKRQSP